MTPPRTASHHAGPAPRRRRGPGAPGRRAAGNITFVGERELAERTVTAFQTYQSDDRATHRDPRRRFGSAGDVFGSADANLAGEVFQTALRWLGRPGRPTRLGRDGGRSDARTRPVGPREQGARHLTGDLSPWPHTIVVGFAALLGRGQRWMHGGHARRAEVRPSGQS